MNKRDDSDNRTPDDTGRDGDTPAAVGQSGAAGADSELIDISTEIHQQVLRERDEYLESLRRLQAEFDNYRKRVARDSESSSSRVAAEIVEDLLPVLDNFERAMQAAAEHDEKVLSDGVELVYRQLRDALDRRGLCEIEALGEDFDPTHHEAVLCQPSTKHDEGKVVDVVEKGYRVHDKVVRPARVIVSEGQSSTGKN